MESATAVRADITIAGGLNPICNTGHAGEFRIGEAPGEENSADRNVDLAPLRVEAW